jgi:hypothetical protein
MFTTMKIAIRLAAILFLALTTRAFCQIHPVYKNLKPYRTYYRVRSVERMAHRFQVWYTEAEPTLATVSANSLEEIRNLTEAGLHLVWGDQVGTPAPSPIPPALRQFADELAARIRKLRPSAQNLVVSYSGFFRAVDLVEFVPLDADADPTLRSAHFAAATVRILPGGVLGGIYGKPRFGVGRLIDPFDSDGPDRSPRFIDMVLPTALEGTSLIYAQLAGISGTYAEQWRALGPRIVHTAEAIANGTYHNPIDRILVAQGTTLLPHNLDSRVTYLLAALPRNADPRKTIERPAFHFSLKAALRSPVSRRLTSPHTGLTYEVTLNLPAQALRLRISNPAGQGATAVYQLDQQSPVSYLNDHGAVAVAGGRIPINTNVNHVVTVPGTTAGSHIDVYPGAFLQAAYALSPQDCEILPEALRFSFRKLLGFED